MKRKPISVLSMLLACMLLITGCASQPASSTSGTSSKGDSSISSSESPADDISSDTDSSQDGASSSAESEAADSSPYHPDAGSSGNGSGTNGGGNKVTSTNYRPVDDPNVVVPAGAKSTQKWVATDIVLTAGKEYANPYLDQAIHCEFKGPQGQKMTIPGFWDGGKKWVIRFAPPVVGKWSYQVKAADTADAGLHQVSGDLYCTKYTGNLDVYKHGFLRVSNDKRGMTYRDGTPFFWLADTHWMGLSHREPLNNSNSKEFSSMFKGMVDVRAKQGYTAYQMNFFLSESGDNGKLDGEYATWNEGGRVWQKDKKWVLPNTGFFSNCDERIQYLAGRGLVSALGFDWGPYAYDDKTVQSFQTAARYIVARYAAYPVVWITCGESRMNSPYWAEIARYVDKIDPYQHPTTLHSGVETQDWGYKSDEYRGEDWYDFAMLQTGHKSSLSSAILNSWKDKYNRTAVIPFLEAEACYEGISAVPKGLTRKMAYTSIMCGSFGYSYGAEGIWNATWDENDDFQLWSGTPIPWYTAIKGEEGAQMQVLKQVFTSTPWWELKPYNTLVTWNRLSGSASNPMVKANTDRTSLLIYYPVPDKGAGYEYTGTVSRLNPGHTYDAVWTNPLNGKTTTAASGFKPDGKGSWKLPTPPSGGQDWVLVITDRVRPTMENAKVIASSYENGSYPYVTGEMELPAISSGK